MTTLRFEANQAYPEHEKLKLAKGRQEIGEFLDWVLHYRKWVIAEYPGQDRDDLNVGTSA